MSLRDDFGCHVELFGYCTVHRLNTAQADVRIELDWPRCDLRGFAIKERFDPPYPLGNKLLATLGKNDTEFRLDTPPIFHGMYLSNLRGHFEFLCRCDAADVPLPGNGLRV